MTLPQQQQDHCIDGLRVLQRETDRRRASHAKIVGAAEKSQLSLHLHEMSVEFSSAFPPPSQKPSTAQAQQQPSSSLPPPQKEGVRFSCVDIYEHPIVVGVNPGGTKGPPLTIAWKAASKFQVSLDDFETTRAGHRRKHLEMAMPSSHRYDILKQLGYSRAEIMAGTKAANIVRQQRRQTQETMSMSGMHEAMEAAKGRIKNVFTLGGGRRARREQQRLDQYVNHANDNLHCSDLSDHVLRGDKLNSSTRPRNHDLSKLKKKGQPDVVDKLNSSNRPKHDLSGLTKTLESSSQTTAVSSMGSDSVRTEDMTNSNEFTAPTPVVNVEV